MQEKLEKNPLPSYVRKMVVTIYLKTIQDSYFKYGIQTKVHNGSQKKNQIF